MAFKVLVLCLAVVLGSNAFLIGEERDMSMFFDHTDPTAPIVGGSDAGNVPYMVALTTGTISRSLFCGGSIISPRTVLTAAHCVQAAGGNNLTVSSLRGTVGTNRWASGGAQYSFQRGIIHPLYNPNQIKNNMAILITGSTIGFSSTVKSIALSYDFAGAGLATRVTGWGRTQDGRSVSPTLLELRPNVIGSNRCVTDLARLAIRAPYVDPRVELCTLPANGNGICNGDSGSPLVRDDRNEQIGIVSFGVACAQAAPNVHVRVDAFRPWIISNTV